ncbi:hypothetical protein Q5H93_02590 [Hymenobacter sp. ASUV-10]|uniref:Outer membrane protein beta-barrel domain-containing protein n=1 Tax=Hymenobacter aranciens TaxID=3063996 RepID=A0ABT9B5W0_9BACT|nr:hypothetical protein [Hymenobacter sp. ASUV-10]MDO7873605.1 hypothetical protein [Hymenobacter sp. ASUV-10]
MNYAHKTYGLAALLAVGTGQGAQAQVSAPRAVPRWYLSAQLFHQKFKGLERTPTLDGLDWAVFTGPVLRGGWQLNSRTALEIGVGGSWPGWRSMYHNENFPPGLTWEVRHRYLYVPVHISRQLLGGSSRWQLIATLGLSYVQQLSEERRRDSNGQVIPETYPYQSLLTSRDLPLLLGAALTYRLAPRWQLGLQGQAACSPRFLFDAGGYFEEAVPGGGGGLELRYGFGERY